MRMKKLILICALLVGGFTAFTSPVNATHTPATVSSSSNELPEDRRPITVYKVVQIGGTWSSSPKDAYYSKSTHCIYVTEGRRENQPYSVSENRAYGQSNDGRAAYRYTAGGYYFDL